MDGAESTRKLYYCVCSSVGQSNGLLIRGPVVRIHSDTFARLAQLGAHLVYTERATSSSLVPSIGGVS